MAKYTYLYNGKVVRKSDHEYNFGLLDHNGEIIACSKTEQGALKRRNDELRITKENARYYEKHNQAEYLEDCKKWIDIFENQWHVVKLERKEGRK